MRLLIKLFLLLFLTSQFKFDIIGVEVVDMLTKEEFSSRLKTAIDRKQIKQVELAEIIGVNPANMSNYVRGKAFPPIDTLVEIRCVFRLAVRDRRNRGRN